MHYLLVFRLLGLILLCFSVSMLVMVPFAVYYEEWPALWRVLESIGISAASGALLFAPARRAEGELYRREALTVVGLSWILVAAFGALPFYLGGMGSGYTDAYFESMSGLTTTGASILRTVEDKPHTLIFWRSFLHFLGGLGIIVFFVAILPILGVGGRALFKSEVPGPKPEGLTPRIKDTAVALCKIYIGLNLLQTIMYCLAGMSFFDSINHAMATLATGGFSTRTASVGAYSPAIQWITLIFMFIAGANFSLHHRFINRDWRCYWRDTEFRVYTGILLAVTLLFMLVTYYSGTEAVSHPGNLNFRDAAFTVTSIMTTTGFMTVDFDRWPEFCRFVLLLLMFVGGCAGSTAGGMKVIRWLILAKTGAHEIGSQATPRAVRILKIAGSPLGRDVQSRVLAFFFLYVSIFIGATAVVAYLTPTQDLISSISAVASCLNNIGPGLEVVGPSMNYADQETAAKWILSLCMVLGRLELHAILVILTPRFWGKR